MQDLVVEKVFRKMIDKENTKEILMLNECLKIR